MKRRPCLIAAIGSVSIICLLLLHGTVLGYDITDKFSIGGVLAGAYQYQSGDDIDDKGRGALPFQPEFSFRPTERDEVFAKFGFAAGNGLNDTTEFNLAPWAADLEDDVKNINGRNRDYLLTVWYKHTFELSESHSLGLTGGIIDATDYIDENAYANDEYTQFMNEALVNAPIGFAPSYDIGGAVEWEVGSWAIMAVGMNVGENDDGNNYNFFAAQLGYKVSTSLGEGNYRLIVQTTSKESLDEDGDKENLLAAIISFDHQLGEMFGAWIRFGWQDDKALIDYDILFSGGLIITGKWYGLQVWTCLGLLYCENLTMESIERQTPVEEAIEFSEKGVRLNPSNQRARVALAMARLLNNQLTEGLVEARNALTLNPNSLIFMDTIGHVMAPLGNWDKGTELINKAIKLNPYHKPYVYHVLCCDWLLKKEYEKAYLETLNFRFPSAFWDPLLQATTLGHLKRRDEGSRFVEALRPIFQTVAAY